MVVGPVEGLSFAAYDGSRTGSADAPIQLRLVNPRGLAYIAGAPSSLGHGPGVPDGGPRGRRDPPRRPVRAAPRGPRPCSHRKRPAPADAARAVRSFGKLALTMPPPPPNEVPSGWHRALHGLRHSQRRDAEAIHHHYDVSNRFYEIVLGPSMAYTCACYPQRRRDAGGGAGATSSTWSAASSACSPACGCWTSAAAGAAWSGTRCASTASPRSASPSRRTRRSGRRRRSRRTACPAGPQVRHQDYRDVAETGFDAVSSIGLTEHIGVRQLPGVLPVPALAAGARRPAAQPLDHPRWTTCTRGSSGAASSTATCSRTAS